MPRIIIEAPAKLNLSLYIGDKRPDGFHDIESLFLALVFGDTLCLETVKPENSLPPLEIDMDWQLAGLQPGGNFPVLSLENNIISRAFSLFCSRTGWKTGLKITVTKRIPLGSGLGGGSSNAAATLLALNRLACRPDEEGLLSRQELAEMGAILGSDVPFFLHNTTAAMISGRGEHVKPVELPQIMASLFFVLVYPGFPSSTAGAFRLFDEFRHELGIREDRRQLLLSDPPHSWRLDNDFLSVFMAAGQKYPTCSEIFSVYQDIITSLHKLGADSAGLSGSGSTCFGVFSDSGKAVTARESFLKRWPYIINTFPLAR